MESPGDPREGRKGSLETTTLGLTLRSNEQELAVWGRKDPSYNPGLTSTPGTLLSPRRGTVYC